MSDTNQCDILIIGAGILGAATAHHLKQKHPELDILLTDRASVAQGNTSKSVSMIRNTFTSPPSFALAASSMNEYKQFHEVAPGGIDLNRMMYLWLFTEAQCEKNRPAISILKENGLDIELLSAEKLQSIAPCMNTNPQDEESMAYGIPPITAGLLCRDGYSVDPVAITQHYVNMFKSNGGRTAYGTAVTDFLRKPVDTLMFDGEELPDQPFPSQPQMVSGVLLENGEKIEAGTTILAIGAWSRELTDKLGKGSLLSAKKRQWFYVESKSLEPLFNLPEFGNEDGTLPFTVFPNGIYAKPSREGGFYVALADDIGRPFNLDTTPERDYFLNAIYPFLCGYLPAFENVTIKAMDAGSYCYDEVYRTPIVDWLHKGVMLVSGGSGSGIMKADAIGRVASSRYESGEPGTGDNEIPLQLPNGITINTNDLTIRGRGRIEPEQLVI